MEQSRPLTGYLQVIGEEWRSRSSELADWALGHVVNRRDVWGQYTVPTEKEKLTSGRSYKALTLPQRKMRGKDMVTREKLQRHFGSLRRNHLIGLHAMGPAGEDMGGAGTGDAAAAFTSRWFAIDIDLHDPDAVDAEDQARRNFAAAVGWWEALQSQGREAILFDSNGAGGFHLWVFFENPAPTADVFAFAQDTVADWPDRNLDAAPETFPKSASLSGNKLGAWLRLPGLHHTKDHFTKVWSGEPWLDDPWYEGNAAIDAIVSVTPGPPPPPAAAGPGATRPGPTKVKTKPRPVPGAVVAPTKKPTFTNERSSKPTVCVDLDGVIARYDRWRGNRRFGDPNDGAIEFMRTLAGFAKIVIFSSRVTRARDIAGTVAAIESWLKTHEIPFDEIDRGNGKPPASAYIDDRAVRCRPGEEGPAAFAEAERRARELCGAPGDRPDRDSAAGLAEIGEIWSGLDPARREALLRAARNL